MSDFSAFSFRLVSSKGKPGHALEISMAGVDQHTASARRTQAFKDVFNGLHPFRPAQQAGPEINNNAPMASGHETAQDHNAADGELALEEAKHSSSGKVELTRASEMSAQSSAPVPAVSTGVLLNPHATQRAANALTSDDTLSSSQRERGVGDQESMPLPPDPPSLSYGAPIPLSAVPSAAVGFASMAHSQITTRIQGRGNLALQPNLQPAPEGPSLLTLSPISTHLAATSAVTEPEFTGRLTLPEPVAPRQDTTAHSISPHGTQNSAMPSDGKQPTRLAAFAATPAATPAVTDPNPAIRADPAHIFAAAAQPSGAAPSMQPAPQAVGPRVQNVTAEMTQPAAPGMHSRQAASSPDPNQTPPTTHGVFAASGRDTLAARAAQPSPNQSRRPASASVNGTSQTIARPQQEYATVAARRYQRAGSGTEARTAQQNPPASSPPGSATGSSVAASTPEKGTMSAGPPAKAPTVSALSPQDSRIPGEHRIETSRRPAAPSTLSAQRAKMTSGIAAPVPGAKTQSPVSQTGLFAGADLAGDEAETVGFSTSAPLREAGSLAAQASGAFAANRPDLARHIALQIASAAPAQSGGPVELRLNPEELGRVRLSLTPGDGAMIVSVIAERGETLDLMRRHINLLAEEFRALGYNDLQFNFGTSQHEKGASRSAAPDISEDPSFQADQPPAASAHASAGRGGSSGLDLRF